MRIHLLLCIAAGLWLASLPEAVAAFADRDIVYSAQHYRWSGKFYHDKYSEIPTPMLRDDGTFHLYRVNPDGSRRLQITFGKYHDWNPCWSPDKRHIFFVRDRDYERAALCLVGASGGKVTTLARFPVSIYNRRFQWSPDGKMVAAQFTLDDAGPDWLYLINVRTRRVRKLPHVKDFAWSPDGHHFYLRYANGSAVIQQTHTNRFIRVASPIVRPLWLDRHTLLGEPPKDQEYMLGSLEQIWLLGEDGRLRRRIPVKPPLGIEAMDLFDSLMVYRRWYVLQPKSPRILLETAHRMSDGWHFGCFSVDLVSGACKFIGAGELAGISPLGNRVMVADHKWVGNYKEFRGGRRVGALMNVNLKTGRTYPITERLIQTAGGDWRPFPAARH